ncbi:hypothetical protein JL720_16463 [Aureococcus anophagefferens]|nr:hypothetical protein JL720_16463 [Aureococcus anophagefferens]
MSLLAKAVKKCVARDMSSQDFVTSVKNMYREGDTFGGAAGSRRSPAARKPGDLESTSTHFRQDSSTTSSSPARSRRDADLEGGTGSIACEQQEAQWRQGQEVQNLILVYTYHQYDPMMSFKEMLLCCVVLFACLLGPAGAGEGATPTCGGEYHEKMEDSSAAARTAA